MIEEAWRLIGEPRFGGILVVSDHASNRVPDDVELGMALPGIRMNTSPTDYFPLEELQMQRFDGARWRSFGPVISGATRN